MLRVIKMLCQVPRKQGMSEAEFYPRYLRGHGGLVRHHAQAMAFLRYVQAHRIDVPEMAGFSAGCSWREPLDGQSELWWESWDSMEAALGSPEGMRASTILEDDEQAFTDTGNVSGFIAQEEVVLDQSDGAAPGSGTAVKIVADLWKRPDLTGAEFRTHWSTQHAVLVRHHAEVLGICKYVQNHNDPETKFDFAALRGWRPAPDGVAEISWPSLDAMQKALSSPAAIAAIAAMRQDENAFTDPSMTRAFAAQEHSIFDLI